MLNLLDTYVGGFPLLIVGIIEAVVIVYFYGINFKSEATKEFPKSFFRGNTYAISFEFLACSAKPNERFKHSSSKENQR